MAATDAMVARLRLMVDEPTDALPYTDAVLKGYIETYPLLDPLGTDPAEVDTTTTPPTLTEADDWIPTYCLNSAARDIWEHKAAAIAENYDFKADGGSYSRSKKYDQFIGQARYHGSRRSTKTSKLWVEPRVSPDDETVIND